MSALRIALFFLLIFLISCGDQCVNTTVNSLTSPDGTFRACAFMRNCGATTGYSVHVFIGAQDDSTPIVGNVFRGTKSQNIEIEWENDHSLIIRTDAEIFLLMKHYAGIDFTLRRDGFPKKR